MGRASRVHRVAEEVIGGVIKALRQLRKAEASPPLHSVTICVALWQAILMSVKHGSNSGSFVDPVLRMGVTFNPRNNISRPCKEVESFLTFLNYIPVYEGLVASIGVKRYHDQGTCKRQHVPQG